MPSHRDLPSRVRVGLREAGNGRRIISSALGDNALCPASLPERGRYSARPGSWPRRPLRFLLQRHRSRVVALQQRHHARRVKRVSAGPDHRGQRYRLCENRRGDGINRRGGIQ